MTEDYPTARPSEIGWLTEARMIEVDRLNPRTVTVIAGSGGNGGLVAARHSANRGVDVTVSLAGAHDALSPVAARPCARP